MKYVNTNPVHPMSGNPGAPSAPATVIRSAILSRSIGASVGMPSRTEAPRGTMSGCVGGLPHDAGPDAPPSLAGSLPGSTVPIGELEKDGNAGLAAKGIQK